MTRGEAWGQHVANLLVGGTGLVYAWMRYLAEPADEFAVVNHPWQPDVQHLHVLDGAAARLRHGAHLDRSRVEARALGLLAAAHASGLALFGLLVPMIASGYLLQVAVAEAARTSCGWIAPRRPRSRGSRCTSPTSSRRVSSRAGARVAGTGPSGESTSSRSWVEYARWPRRRSASRMRAFSLAHVAAQVAHDRARLGLALGGVQDQRVRAQDHDAVGELGAVELHELRGAGCSRARPPRRPPPARRMRARMARATASAR
jgi:hypothetical protein